jgi:ribonuclease HI
MVELLACRDAVFLARTKGWSHVILETDCQLIVNAWKDGKWERSDSAAITREMKASISVFQGFRFEFVRRDANKAAHVCARSALLLESSDISFELIPDFLIEPIQSDILSSFE